MIIGRGSGDYTVKYRPCLVEEVIGQDVAKDIIKRALSGNIVAPAYLFHGESGTGKTTMARILAMGVNCLAHGLPTPEPCMECENCNQIYLQRTPEYMEINVGDKTGVDSARDLTGDLIYSTIDLKRRMVVLDECQQMTSQAQNMLLKPIEDATADTHFILCTTEPKKIIKPLRSRCKPIEFKRVSKPNLLVLLESICQFEGLEYNVKNLRLMLIENPSPRDAVSSLQQVVTANKLNDSNWIRKFMDQLTEEEEGQVIELARLVNKGYWKPVAQKVKQLANSYSEEQMRIILALYFTKALLNAKSEEEAKKFSIILNWLKQPIYTHKPLIELTHALYNATKRKRP